MARLKEEIKEQRLYIETSKSAAIEALDVAVAAFGLAYVICRDNGLDFERIKWEHHQKDAVRGYHDTV